MQEDRQQSIKQLLDDCRHALAASNAQQALQCVVQALKLLHGDNAVLPTLRAAAEHYHAQQAAPIDELSQLLAHVSLAAEEDAQAAQRLQQQAYGGQAGMQWASSSHGGAQAQHTGQQQSDQAAGSSRPILEETGRGSFTEAAIADGSSLTCPHCGGVIPLQRQQAHLSFWCPALQQQQQSPG